jgi:hypothetical protein
MARQRGSLQDLFDSDGSAQAVRDLTGATRDLTEALRHSPALGAEAGGGRDLAASRLRAAQEQAEANYARTPQGRRDLAERADYDRQAQAARQSRAVAEASASFGPLAGAAKQLQFGMANAAEVMAPLSMGLSKVQEGLSQMWDWTVRLAGAASPTAVNTLNTSFQLLAAQIGRHLVPVIEAAARGLQYLASLAGGDSAEKQLREGRNVQDPTAKLPLALAMRRALGLENDRNTSFIDLLSRSVQAASPLQAMRGREGMLDLADPMRQLERAIPGITDKVALVRKDLEGMGGAHALAQQAADPFSAAAAGAAKMFGVLGFKPAEAAAQAAAQAAPALQRANEARVAENPALKQAWDAVNKVMGNILGDPLKRDLSALPQAQIMDFKSYQDTLQLAALQGDDLKADLMKVQAEELQKLGVLFPKVADDVKVISAAMARRNL